MMFIGGVAKNLMGRGIGSPAKRSNYAPQAHPDGSIRKCASPIPILST